MSTHYKLTCQELIDDILTSVVFRATKFVSQFRVHPNSVGFVLIEFGLSSTSINQVCNVRIFNREYLSRIKSSHLSCFQSINFGRFGRIITQSGKNQFIKLQLDSLHQFSLNTLRKLWQIFHGFLCDNLTSAQFSHFTGLFSTGSSITISNCGKFTYIACIRCISTNSP